jgi:hypothetical protein
MAKDSPRIVDDALRTEAPDLHHTGRPRRPDSQALVDGKTIFVPGLTVQLATRKYNHLRQSNGTSNSIKIRLTQVDGQRGTLIWLEKKSPSTPPAISPTAVPDLTVPTRRPRGRPPKPKS